MNGMTVQPGQMLRFEVQVNTPMEIPYSVMEDVKFSVQAYAIEALNREFEACWIPSGTSAQKTASVANLSAGTTAARIGPSGKCSSSSGTTGYLKSGFGFCGESGKTAMYENNNKGVILNQGGKFGFTIQKHVNPGGVERFTVGFRGFIVTNERPWAEASQAMNDFKDEFEDAFAALVEISTLTPSGAHEES